MDLTLQILLFIHIIAFGVVAASNIAMPLVGARMAGAGPDAAAALGAIARQLGTNARISVATLVITGIALVQLKYGGVAGMNAWFWAKMTLVTIAVIFMIATPFLPRNALNPRIFGPVMRLVLLGIVLAAVLAFN